MPTTIQGLLILFFVLPGFLATELDAKSRPAKERSIFDKTVLCVLYSTLVHVALILVWTYVAVSGFGFDLALLTEEWLLQQWRDHPLWVEGFVVAYLATSMVGGWAVGRGLSKLNRNISRSWERFTCPWMANWRPSKRSKSCS